MSLMRRFIWKDEKGVETEYDLGAKASNVVQDATHRFVTDAEKTAWNAKQESGSDTNTNVVTFAAATTRANIKSGETQGTIMGKIYKFFADMATVAFSGSYADLSNRPTIPSGAAASCAVANNDTTTAAGYVADARIVRTHGLEIDQISSDLATKYNKNYYTWPTLSLAAVLNKLFSEVHTSYGSYTSMIQCSEGYFSVWGFRTSTAVNGFATHAGAAYSFSGNVGADAALKKLGSGITQVIASTAMPLTFSLDGIQSMVITVTATASYTGLSVTGKKSDGTSVTLIAGTNNTAGLTVGTQYNLDVSTLTEVTVQNSGNNYASFKIEFS